MDASGSGVPGEVSDTAKGFGYSIYFMLLLVFSLMGTIVFFVARMMVREERQRAAREAAARISKSP